MGMVPPKQLGDIRSTSTRTFECQSRPGIQNVTGFQRLETRPLDVSITSGEMEALGDRSLCIPLLHLCTDLPLLFPTSPKLVMKDNRSHPLANLQLAGWKLSANVMTQQIFRKQLETFCWQPGGRTLPALTPPRGVNGLAGVIDGKSIPFQLL